MSQTIKTNTETVLIEKRPPHSKTTSRELEMLRLKMELEKNSKSNLELNHKMPPLKQQEALVGAGIKAKALIIELAKSRNSST